MLLKRIAVLVFNINLHASVIMYLIEHMLLLNKADILFRQITIHELPLCTGLYDRLNVIMQLYSVTNCNVICHIIVEFLKVSSFNENNS